MFGRTTRHTGKAATLAGISALALVTATSAFAQTAEPKQQAYAPEEIIVTARKREETIMKTPVIMQAISAPNKNQRPHMNGLARCTSRPAFMHNRPHSSSAAACSCAASATAKRHHVDQSVAMNIDGFSFSHGASTAAACSTCRRSKC